MTWSVSSAYSRGGRSFTVPAARGDDDRHVAARGVHASRSGRGRRGLSTHRDRVTEPAWRPLVGRRLAHSRDCSSFDPGSYSSRRAGRQRPLADALDHFFLAEPMTDRPSRTDHSRRRRRRPRADAAPVPKRKKPGPYRAAARNRHGLLIVNTGDGKGNDRGAGVLLRATGATCGHKSLSRAETRWARVAAARPGGDRSARRWVYVVVGEHRADRALAAAGWARVREAPSAGRSTLILDELTTA